MAHFQAVGCIATDVVRRETNNGVLATFRLASGQRGRGQLWIDIEAWGHTAGVVGMHGCRGRGVVVSGRLKRNTWRDRSTGEARSRLVVVAGDVDFLDAGVVLGSGVDVPNQVTVAGRVSMAPVADGGAGRVRFSVVVGSAGSKTGRLELPVVAWGRTVSVAAALTKGADVAVAGRLKFQPNESCHALSAFRLAVI